MFDADAWPAVQRRYAFPSDPSDDRAEIAALWGQQEPEIKAELRRRAFERAEEVDLGTFQLLMLAWWIESVALRRERAAASQGEAAGDD